MKQFTYKVRDEQGIHARPASVLAKIARKYNSRIRLQKGESAADMRKMIAMMGLNVHVEDQVEIVVDGEDEDAAYQEVYTYFQENI